MHGVARIRLDFNLHPWLNLFIYFFIVFYILVG